MAKPQSIIFYSWQSDLPNKTNRGFIQDALEKAAKELRKDDSIQVEPVIDRDVAGIPGSPDISQAIFDKITRAEVFVCDISIINQDAISQVDARPTPNPNVLIELGYALHALSDKHILLVLNDAYGIPKQLPFDLYTRHAIVYHMPEDAAERATERNRLTGIFTDALRTILGNLDKPLPGELIEPSLCVRAKNAIENAQPNQIGIVQQYLAELINRITEMNPKYIYEDIDHCYEQLIETITESNELIIEFAQVAEAVANMNAKETAYIIYRGFEKILNLYTIPHTQPGGLYYPFEKDFAKFVGHELFVIFFSFLIREERWELIAELLQKEFYARKSNFERFTMVPFHRLSELIILLADHKERHNLPPISFHADLLEERYSTGKLADLIPLEQFAEADYFLFLRAQLASDENEEFPIWMPWSSLKMRQIPRYLQQGKRITYAQQLFQPLGMQDIQTLRTRLVERTGSLEKGWGMRPFRVWDNIMGGFDFNTIGTL